MLEHDSSKGRHLRQTTGTLSVIFMKILKQIVILQLLILTCSTGFGQKEDRIWYFGGDPFSFSTPGAGLDFNSGFPVPLVNSAMGYSEGSAVQCDRNGNLLFYTDGSSVWDVSHAIMMNGTGLGGHISSEQSTVIIPFPSYNDTSKFYLFGNDGFPTANGTGLYYSIIDMSLNAGLGAVTATKAVSLLDSTSEWLSASKHSNGIDFWVVTADYDSTIFYSYKVDASGISPPVITNLGYNSQALFKLDFNNKGDRVSYRAYDNNNMYWVRIVADFNQATGVISNPISLDTTIGGNLGAGFSSNDSLFYSFSLVSGNITLLQYNLFASNIYLSKQTILSFGTSNHLDMKNGPDGKLYVSNNTTDSVDVINFPNIIGIGCDYQKNAIYLNGRKYRFFFPNKTFEIAKAPLGVGENNLQESLFTIYPNPSNGNFEISKNKIFDKYIICNAMGQEIYKATFNKTKDSETIPFQLPKGVFFVIAFDNNGNSCSKKLIVN